MLSKRSTAAALAALAMALSLVACGSSGAGAVEGQSYAQILRGLEKAALAGQTYRAAHRAHDLSGAEEAMLEEFCYFSWQMKVNREAYKLDERPYVVGRLTGDAEYKMKKPNPAEIKTAFDELRSVIDIDKLNGKLVRRYSKACYA